jgi:hypothetical protein
MVLIASPPVFRALERYLNANAYNNAARTSRLYSLLIHAMRADIQPPIILTIQESSLRVAHCRHKRKQAIRGIETRNLR